MRALPVLLLLFATSAVRAEIYVCENNGQKTYSQQPCGSDAKSVEVGTSDGSINLPERLDPEASLAVCKLIFRGLDISTRLAHQRIGTNDIQERVAAFLREHISNFSEVVRRNPHFYDEVQNSSRVLTAYGYSDHHLTDEERAAGINSCASSLYEEDQKHHGAGGSVPSQGQPAEQKRDTFI